MIVRSIDVNGDWLFGKGKSDYNSGQKAVEQNIKTRLRSFLGNCFFAVDAGVDWFNLLGAKNQLALQLAVRSTILNTAYVSGIVSLDVFVDPVTRAITLTYTITTSIQATIQNTTVTNTVSLLVTESGDIITTEDGLPLGLG